MGARNPLTLSRCKALVGVLGGMPGEPTRTRLIKLLFLARKETSCLDVSWFYDFVPYRYGPFSFTLYKDLGDLEQVGCLSPHALSLSRRGRGEAKQAFDRLAPAVRGALEDILRRYGTLPRGKLVSHVYKQYPWYGSRSVRAGASRRRRRAARKAVYTAGYEGESIDTFLAKLLRAGIERLIDVRHTPASRKYGFSKRALARLCEHMGIDYVHFRDLGIPPSHRRGVTSLEDYRKLLKTYERTLLPRARGSAMRVSQLMSERPSVLVCVESDVSCCHRSRVAEFVSARIGLDAVHL